MNSSSTILPTRPRIAFRPRTDGDNGFIERVTRQELVPTLERAWRFTWDDGHARKFMIDLLTVGETLIVIRPVSEGPDIGSIHVSDIADRHPHCGSEPIGDPIGYVWYIVRPGQRRFFSRPIFWINYLIVDRQFQGRGIGTQVIAHCVERARGAGCGSIGLWAQTDNPRAVNFYRRLRFKARRAEGSNIPMFRKL